VEVRVLRQFQYAIAILAAALVALTSGRSSSSMANSVKRNNAPCSLAALWRAPVAGLRGEVAGRHTPRTRGDAAGTGLLGGCRLQPTVTAIQKMDTLPFRPKQLLPLVIAALLPFLPVAAIEIPLKEILVQVLKMLK